MIDTTEVITVRSLRHLDALVAEKLMGFVWGKGSVSGRLKLFPPDEIELVSFSRVAAPDDLSELEKWEVFIPPYTTWPGLEPVIRNREEAGYFWEFYQESDALMRKAWTVGLVILDSMGDRELVASGHHNTAPTAACIAALASAGIRCRLDLGEE